MHRLDSLLIRYSKMSTGCGGVGEGVMEGVNPGGEEDTSGEGNEDATGSE